MASAVDRIGGEERIDRLRLIRSSRIGPATFQQLIARFGSATAALAALPDLARRGGGSAPPIADRALAEREMAMVARMGARHVMIGDADYPPLLAASEGAPPVFTVRGDAGLAARPMVAMVGARNASAAGCRLARGLAQALGEAGLVVVSGLARGIDAAAHQGSLASGTVAVVAGGIDIVYPPEHAELQERIANEGLLIAEQPPGTEPRARHFPYRNRIIAGLAAGTVVVEAAPRSGSLITARLAAEAGREVMAIPGSPLDARAQGCNLLIREGATLVQGAEDVIETLGPIDRRAVRSPPPRYAPAAPAEAGEGERATIRALLGPVPVAVDEIVRQSGSDSGTVQTVLLELELAGRVERHAGGRISRA